MSYKMKQYDTWIMKVISPVGGSKSLCWWMSQSLRPNVHTIHPKFCDISNFQYYLGQIVCTLGRRDSHQFNRFVQNADLFRSKANGSLNHSLKRCIQRLGFIQEWNACVLSHIKHTVLCLKWSQFILIINETVLSKIKVMTAAYSH